MGASFEAFVAEEHEAAFRALLREQGKARAEIALRAGNGAGIPVYISSSRVMIDSCEAVCLIATDLTEQKREETSLAEEQRRIEERIRANDQLAAMGMAAAALAHEIANPLHWISTTVQLMQRELAGGSQAATPSWKESLANIHKEINRMGAMLQEFRSLARPMKLNVAPLDLREFIAEVEKVIVAELNSAAIRLERDISTELPRVHVDEQKLQQVLLNIYKNAVEAMPSGGTLTAKAYPEAGNVVIEISDTGLGIPEDIDIFEPFTTTKDKGTGLGLMIVRQIIAAHAGSISYRSKQDEGTTFHIVLPCSVKNTEQRQKS
jgi:signal transduction histidine kinase